MLHPGKSCFPAAVPELRALACLVWWEQGPGAPSGTHSCPLSVSYFGNTSGWKIQELTLTKGGTNKWTARKEGSHCKFSQTAGEETSAAAQGWIFSASGAVHQATAEELGGAAAPISLTAWFKELLFTGLALCLSVALKGKENHVSAPSLAFVLKIIKMRKKKKKRERKKTKKGVHESVGESFPCWAPCSATEWQQECLAEHGVLCLISLWW